MNAVLPDVCVDLSPMFSPLELVGVQGIDLPVTINELGYHRELHATADVQVDLPAPQVKSIHMSRLYRLLDSWGQERRVSLVHIRKLLSSIIKSHFDCDNRSARIRLDFDLLIRRAVLVTEGLSGWKSYPVQVNASLIEGAFSLSNEIIIGYSSTCPCSAALSRQLIEEGFLQTFSHQPLIERGASICISWPGGFRLRPAGLDQRGAKRAGNARADRREANRRASFRNIKRPKSNVRRGCCTPDSCHLLGLLEP